MNYLNYLMVTVMLVMTACGSGKTGADQSSAAVSDDSTSYQLMQAAYAYGLPLVLMDITKRQFTDPSMGENYAPVNHFKHLNSFPDASFRNVVRPNADTYYSTAMLDLTSEPVVLSIPNTRGRYHLFPMLDAYTNVFASPGTRTTGNEGGQYLISGPGWNGTVPAGMNQISAPTNLVWMIGRTQVNSKEDGNKTVVPLQKQFTLSPLSAAGAQVPMPEVKADPTVPKGDPNSVVKGLSTTEFFNYMNSLLALYPPPAADSTVLKSFALLNIGPGMTFSKDALSQPLQMKSESLSADFFVALEEGMSSGKQLINGWSPGAKVIGTYGTDYISRAAVSYFGLGANLREDAVYISCDVDADGAPLNGANEYVLQFEKGQSPPVNAFWSMTMYDPQGYFIENPINRYAIGDRSRLQMNADGSYDIYIQTKNPGNSRESNWLPAPSGAFNLLLRLYWPKEEVLNGSWTSPGVKKL
jgi:hypothetical protein